MDKKNLKKIKMKEYKGFMYFGLSGLHPQHNSLND